jgi:putative ABC transport system permease protein
MATDIGWVGVAASLTLVVVALALSWWQGLRLGASISWAAVRAAAQLLVWVVVMVLVAALTIRHRARVVPSVFLIGLLAIGTVAVVSLTVIFGLGIFPTESRAIVPLAGMMIGNAMSATVLSARRIVDELGEHRAEIEARLALGQPWPQASRPYVRTALRTALTPQIETTKAVGLIALPGAMTGLILAGVDPVDAVQVQLAIMFLILGSVACSVTVIGLGLTRQFFTTDHRMVRLPG